MHESLLAEKHVSMLKVEEESSCLQSLNDFTASPVKLVFKVPEQKETVSRVAAT